MSKILAAGFVAAATAFGASVQAADTQVSTIMMTPKPEFTSAEWSSLGSYCLLQQKNPDSLIGLSAIYVKDGSMSWEGLSELQEVAGGSVVFALRNGLGTYIVKNNNVDVAVLPTTNLDEAHINFIGTFLPGLASTMDADKLCPHEQALNRNDPVRSNAKFSVAGLQ